MLTVEGMEKNEILLVSRTPTPTPNKCTSAGLNDEPDAANNNIDANKEITLVNDVNLNESLEILQKSCNDIQINKQETSSSSTTTTKLNETNNSNNTCPFANHHYHYIDYPAAYYQRKSRKNVNVSITQNSNSNAYHYCACSCSCDGHMQMASKFQKQQQQQQHHHHHPQQQEQLEPQHNDHNSRMAVAAIVHQQQSTDVVEHTFRTRSEQSLASHSYQVLNVLPEKKSSTSCRSKLNINSDVECNCNSSLGQIMQRSNKKCKNFNDVLTESMLATADEITVSESDNNGSMTKRKNMRESRVHKKINSWYEKNYNCNHIEIYSDGEEIDGNRQNDAIIQDDAVTNILDQRPPLPPRPQAATNSNNFNDNHNAHRPGANNSLKKYVIWCLICGGFSCLLGALFLGVYFLLHSYTITVGNFETVPTFVPATLLILTGVCIMSLARRRNRYSYLIKLSGACGLISALTCALVTVTTTVLHMSRLQALRECEYAQKTRTCTCYDMVESQVDRVDKEGVRLVFDSFDSLSDCGVVHGSLYSCLRAIFGLSVAGVLTSVFSCMLVYQLLSHERKKMYWEQLELRCRSLYSTHQQQHPSQASGPHNMATIASIGSRNAVCRCCEQCHAHRQLQLQAAASYPWVDDVGEPRFWSGQQPGNFYSPNPCGDENNHHNHMTANNRNRLTTGWSWPRMPWQRSSSGSGTRFRQVPSSPDSQYGFSSANASLGITTNNVTLPTTAVEDEATAAAMAAVAAATATQRAAQVFNMAANNNLPYGVWGPPPPYSDPNSPARRGFYQYMQTPNNICNVNRTGDNSGVGSSDEVLQHRPLSAGALNTITSAAASNTVHCVNQRTFDHLTQLCASGQMENVFKSKEQNVTAPTNNDFCNSCSDSDVDALNLRRGDHCLNTLPTRKMKKRVIDGSGSIAKCTAPNSRYQHSTHRINVQRVFPGSSNSLSENDIDANGNPRNHCGVMKTLNNNSNNNYDNDNRSTTQIDNNMNNRIMQKIMIADNIENNTFHNNTVEVEMQNNDADVGASGMMHHAVTNCDDPSESEIYFADVSSCCNMSMKNGNCYEDCNLKAMQKSTHNVHATTHYLTPQRNQISNHQQLHQHQHQHQRSNCSQSSNASCCLSKERLSDFTQRENSVRSRQQHQQRQDDPFTTNKKKQNPIQMKSCNNNNTNDILTRLDNKLDISMPKDNSMHSMCSVETECTDLTPTTPCNNSISVQTILQSNNANHHHAQSDLSNTISNTFPDVKLHEAYRRLTKNLNDNAMSSGIIQDSHYEVINDEMTTSSMTPQPQIQRSRNFKTNCNIGQGSLGRGIYGRNDKSKSHMDRPSDAGGGNRHRQRM